MLDVRPELVRLDAVAPGQPLDGIIGPDPRGVASAERGYAVGEEIVSRTSSFLLNLLYHMSALQRAAYMEALRAGTRVLERLVQLRETQPKRLVPPVMTPAYVAYCQALAAGDYTGARAHAERKLADLTQ
jgi:hypothetical protein